MPSVSLRSQNGIFVFISGVTDISPRVGSNNGGTLLTISGRHFYSDAHAPAKVQVVYLPLSVSCEKSFVQSYV